MSDYRILINLYDVIEIKNGYSKLFIIEGKSMNEEKNISKRILTSFSRLDYTFDVYENYPLIYNKLKGLIPKTETSFRDFELNTCIGCEMICAAICHSMNWDFLRKTVKKKTISNPTWLLPENLSKIMTKDVEELLIGYEKKERIRALERSKLLADIGKRLLNQNKFFIDLFFFSSILRSYDDIRNHIKQFDAFSEDPAEKKFRLLIQCVSDYEPLSSLSEYYEPTIDYHITRMYVRRGVVIPVKQEAVNFILNEEIVRKESTVGALRTVCAESMNYISWLTQIDVKTISRIEWWVARTICVNDNPDCILKGEEAKWVRERYNKCPFYNICNARKEENGFLKIDEPKYGGKSY